MKQYTEITDVPTDLEVVDSMGFTWKYAAGAEWVWYYRGPARTARWIKSGLAARGESTAFMGPFAEVR